MSKIILQYALEYHRLGWCVIPIPFGKKAARKRWREYQKSRPNEEQLRKWFQRGKRNMAVVLGEVSGGLASRDFDIAEEYTVWTMKHPRLAKILPTVKTASGYHVYFKGHYEGIQHIANGELRGSGGYCILPPSLHPDGQIYVWVNPLLSENLWDITPEVAGFIRNVTEQTQQTEQTEAIKSEEWGNRTETEKEEKRKNRNRNRKSDKRNRASRGADSEQANL